MIPDVLVTSLAILFWLKYLSIFSIAFWSSPSAHLRIECIFSLWIWHYEYCLHTLIIRSIWIVSIFTTLSIYIPIVYMIQIVVICTVLCFSSQSCLFLKTFYDNCLLSLIMCTHLLLYIFGLLPGVIWLGLFMFAPFHCFRLQLTSPKINSLCFLFISMFLSIYPPFMPAIFLLKFSFLFLSSFVIFSVRFSWNLCCSKYFFLPLLLQVRGLWFWSCYCY